MDRRITPDDVDNQPLFQAGQSRLPRRSTSDVDARSSSQAGRTHLPHQSTPDNVDIDSPSQAGQSRLPRRITPNDVDTRWPYRAGYPRLLRPYVESRPIEAAEKPISDANFKRLRSRIFEILKSYDLPWSKSVPSTLPEVVYRKQEFGTSGLARVLIHCSYDKETSCSQKWTAAVAEIYAETQSMVEGDHEVGVELADMEFMDSEIISLPTPMSQELSANWENGHKYREQILQLFEARSPMFRAMIPMGRRSVGELTSELIEVIFFGALNAEDNSWDSIEARIRLILPSHIDIDIRQGSGPSFCLRFSENNAEGDIPSPEEYTRPPRPGHDIGAMGSRSAGTMGGYVVTADKNGKKTT
ncbi:hypothetical protein ZTR_03694 [Talaromyces verruculosus]|nr:hypothetical protein ZTR_03694 [Talaromyces verruculosus]